MLNDPYTSKRHLRIYTVVYENDEPGEVDTLVYAEDLSQNGTYWNGSFIGKGNGGFLLSDQDILRLSRRTYIVFSAALSGQSSGELRLHTRDGNGGKTECTHYVQHTDSSRNSARTISRATDCLALAHLAEFSWQSNRILDIKLPARWSIYEF